MAACALATCHSVCQASHAAASPACEKLPSRTKQKKRGRRAWVPSGAEWRWCAATAPSHPGPCPGSTSPSPWRHGPRAMARAPWRWRDRRRLTSRLASLCGLGRARFAPHRRHTRSQAPDTYQARPRSRRLPSRCALLRRRALWRCPSAAVRAQRQARKGVARAQPVNAVADREGADHHVVRDERNGSLDAEPTSSSRVAPAPCHEARQEQQQRRQPASAAGAVRVHERRPPERDSETPQLRGAGRGDQAASTPHGRTAADCVPSCRGARAKHWQPQRRQQAHVLSYSVPAKPRQHSARLDANPKCQRPIDNSAD